MDITIRPGTLADFADCEEAMINSELGTVYFNTPGRARELLTAALEQGGFFIAADAQGRCLGFLWYAERGMCSSFPYVRLLAVKAEHRGQGVGRQLLAYAEGLAFPQNRALFILVSDFNTRARSLYERLGYEYIGTVPDLFKDGVGEHFLVKQAQ